MYPRHIFNRKKSRIMWRLLDVDTAVRDANVTRHNSCQFSAKCAHHVVRKSRIPSAVKVYRSFPRPLGPRSVDTAVAAVFLVDTTTIKTCACRGANQNCTGVARRWHYSVFDAGRRQRKHVVCGWLQISNLIKSILTSTKRITLTLRSPVASISRLATRIDLYSNEW